ncbi:Cyclin-dependent kinase 11 [Colletotrichum shisoi]|uniref:Cyclin-dependent kinase 11 n=1 Tax=Colletotrichum shisoi TaxID=2078593 RepID=A0A5Q4BIA8_9PEZI|nr:Cyclin-dependent kinase 11 [Colletotrichum shisoi]
MSGTETDPDSAGIGEQSTDGTTPPSTPQHRSLETEPSSESPGQRRLFSPQTWPKDYRTTTLFELRKQVIEEPDETLFTRQLARQTNPIIHPGTLVVGIRDASEANDFTPQDTFRRRPPRPTTTIISDGGNQRYQETKPPRPARQDEPGSAGSTLGSPNPNLDVHDSGSRRSSSFETRYKLQKQLRAACQQVENPMERGNPKMFLPKVDLERIINPQSVAQELAERRQCSLDNVQLRRQAEAVCNKPYVDLGGGKKHRTCSFRSVFAILVLIGKSDSIGMFIKENVSDLDLPLKTRDDPSRPECHDLYRRNPEGSPHAMPLDCSNDWSPGEREQFYQQQWRMLAPFFSLSAYNHVNHYPLTEEHLPFIKCQNDHPGDVHGSIDDGQSQDGEIRGGTSQVYMVWIHPDHHNFHQKNGHKPDPGRGFAIKKLEDENRGKFDQEIEMLKKFTGRGFHSHVVSILATYSRFGKYHLIFNRADGDLFDYWKAVCQVPEFDYGTVLWVSKQLAGLASGLLRFHRHQTNSEKAPKEPARAENNGNGVGVCCQDQGLSEIRKSRLPGKSPQPLQPHDADSQWHTQFGRHGDLKPENILWFPDVRDKRGILKITDFGQAELHSKTSKTYRRSKGFDTLTYRSPECDTPPQLIRQSSDIWSLGCISLEFVTWLLGGAKYLDDFKRSRLLLDHHVNPIKTDIFWERVPLGKLDHVGTRLKPAVSKVGNHHTQFHICLFRSRRPGSRLAGMPKTRPS